MKDDYICHVPDDCGLHHMWPVARNHMKDKGVDLLTQKVEINVFAHAINGGVCIDAEAAHRCRDCMRLEKWQAVLMERTAWAGI